MVIQGVVRRCTIGRQFGQDGRIYHRGLHDNRSRLSNFWTPTQNQQQSSHDQPQDESHQLLQRAGFLRQAHTGLFHMLPLGLRVQEKIERLIDKHMRSLGASKLSLSSLSSQDLWRRSGRLEGRGSELFHLEDRKQVKYLLAPTHEEEITTIVANLVHSYRDLPLRLYQISRKYRDEARPRQGLLRGREFIMKDLYTFDATDSQARQTYEEVRRAYVAFLDELRLPYIVANADSGNMGGSLSHEYHFIAANGEDRIIQCSQCEYSTNEELYVGKSQIFVYDQTQPTKTWRTLTNDRSTLVTVHYPSTNHELNVHAVKAVVPDIDTTIENADSAIRAEKLDGSKMQDTHLYDPRIAPGDHSPPIVDDHPILFTKARQGDPCPSCASGALTISSAVEIGHTFHLGTRYSTPLSARVLTAENKRVDIAMGCHGVGVSRLIGAIASLLRDARGLNWPLVVAPWEVVVVPGPHATPAEYEEIYDLLARRDSDVVIDDRNRPLGWKLNDADLVGYPFIVVLGKSWQQDKRVELQCRRLGIREQLTVQELHQKIQEHGKRL